MLTLKESEPKDYENIFKFKYFNMSFEKVIASAPSNLAFVKYWGRKDGILRLPINASISMCLSGLLTNTAVQFKPDLEADKLVINGRQTQGKSFEKFVKHLDRIREMAGERELKAEVVTENSFPSSTGLSSSASGFAALSLAASKALGLDLSEEELSILARKGSGSACRSIPDGIVYWHDGDTDEESYAKSIYPPDYWDICDLVAIVNSGEKKVSSSDGQELAATSPFFEARKSTMPSKIKDCLNILKRKDFTAFGELCESEALELHCIMLSSRPPLIYWEPATLMLIKLCHELREQGLEVYFSINTGQDVHLLVLKKDLNRLKEIIDNLPYVRETIVNFPSNGARIVTEDSTDLT